MKIPGMGLATAPLKDIGRSFSYGFDMPGNVKEKGLSGIFTGFSPHIGGSVVGAGIGAAAGMVIDDVNPISSTIGGAAIGAAALPAAGLLGAGAYGLGAGVLNNSDKILSGIGTAGRSIGVGIGRAVHRSLVGPEFKGNTKLGKAAAGLGNRLLNPASRYLGTLDWVTNNFVSFEPRRQVFDEKRNKMVSKGGFKMKWLGWGVLGAGAMIGAARDVKDVQDSYRIGQRDPYITRATPRIPTYVDNAGATGDLVFALNANRRG